MNNYSLKNWFLAIRPKTLAAGFAPVLLAGAVAGRYDFRSLVLWLCCFVVALSLQISANLINDYYDWHNDIDGQHSLGPLRVTSSGLISPLFVKLGGLAFLGLAAGVGLFAAWLSSWYILLPGAFCLLFAWGYSGGRFALSYLSLGELSAFIFFGIVAGSGSYYLISGGFSLESLAVSVMCGFYAAAIMSVNNLRDIKTDLAGGKRTLASRLGEPLARKFTVALLLAAVFMPVLLVIITGRWWLLLCLLVLPIVYKACHGILTEDISPRFNSYLAGVSATEVLTSLIIAVVYII